MRATFGPRAVTLLTASFLLLTPVAGASVWTNGGGDFSWTNPLNWTGGVPNSVDAVADFDRLDITSDSTVNLNAAQTVGMLLFGDPAPSHNWILNRGTGGSLRLDVSAGVPRIQVANPTANPTPSVNSVNFFPSVSQSATINANLAGNEGFAKTGAGTLVLTQQNLYSGATELRFGTVHLDFSPLGAATANILPSGTTMILGGGLTGGTGGVRAGSGAFGGDVDYRRGDGISRRRNRGECVR